MYIPVGLKLIFEKMKFKFLHFNLISSVPGFSKDETRCLKASLLTILFLNIGTYSNGYL